MNVKLRPWWFFCTLPAALVLSYLVWIVRLFAGGGWNDFVEMGGWAALIGCATFPIGAPFEIWISPPVVSRHLLVFSGMGYFVYVAICVLGLRRRSWNLFVLICVLLILNILGCHVNHTIDSLPLSQ